MGISPEQIQEILRRNLIITGDGNIVGNNANVKIAKFDQRGQAVEAQINVAGDFIISVEKLEFRLPADDLRHLLTPPQENAPSLPTEVPYLHFLIGHEAEKQALLDLYAQVCQKRHGITVFLTGKSGSGRHALTEWLQAQVYAQGGSVAAARFWDIRLLPPEKQHARLYWDGPAMAEYGSYLLESFQQAKTLAGDPWLNLAAQLTPHAVPRDVTRPGWPDDPRTLSQFVRRAARRKPLLLTVEYLDWADSLWIDLLRCLADEIAQDSPVMLLITLDAPVPVDRLSDKQHTEPTRLVQTLLRENQAHAFHLGPVTGEEIVTSLSVTPEVGNRLLYLSEGDPWIVQLLWEEWQAQGAVEVGWDGVWHVNAAQDGEWWVFGDARDHAHALLSGLLKKKTLSSRLCYLTRKTPSSRFSKKAPASRFGYLTKKAPVPRFGQKQAKTLLNCAAVEGEIFTARAVAAALDVDPDNLMNFFDNYLRVPPDKTTDKVNGRLVRDEGFVTAANGDLCRYRFARPYLHHIFAKYPKRVEERRTWSSRLAEALERFYYPQTGPIADTLCRLFEAAGMPERAEPYRRVRLHTPDLDVLRWHVRFLQETTTADDRFGTYRLFDVGFQLSTLITTQRPDLWKEGYDLALDLQQRAEVVGDRCYQADALHDAAWHLHNGGCYSDALPLARQAVALYETCHGLDSPAVARGLNMLGSVLQDLGDLPGARAALARALYIWEQSLGSEHPQVAVAVNNLGSVLHALGDLPGARAAYERALHIWEQSLGPEHLHVAAAVNNLGAVLKDLCDLSGARAAFERALRILQNSQLPPGHPYIRSLRDSLTALDKQKE